MMRRCVGATTLILLMLGSFAAQEAEDLPPEGPIIEVETSRGTFAFVTFVNDAPRSVARVLALAETGFYDGLRFHRAIPDFLIQTGDPRSRDTALRAWWGRGTEAGTGEPIGVAEISKTRTHSSGTVGLAHPGNPALADSQFYITLGPQRRLDRKYTIIGRLVAGEEVVRRITTDDVILRVIVRRHQPEQPVDLDQRP